jgi:hypothetical protein
MSGDDEDPGRNKFRQAGMAQTAEGGVKEYDPDALDANELKAQRRSEREDRRVDAYQERLVDSYYEQIELQDFQAHLIAAFEAHSEELKRDGLPNYRGGRFPWALATETRKLEQLVSEFAQMTAGNENVGNVAGTVLLEAIERNIDYAQLPEATRNDLQMLRVDVEAGDKETVDGRDSIAPELDRIVRQQYGNIDHNANFQIWQAHDPSAAAAGWSAFPADYRRAIDVTSESLAGAYEATNEGGWWEANEVEVIADEVRSTTVGDVIVDPGSKAHRITSEGYKLVDPATEKPARDEPPLERVERQLAEWKFNNSPDFVPDPAAGRIGPGTYRPNEDGWGIISEAHKLHVLELDVDWTGVNDKEKELVLAREVDFSRITRDDFNTVYQDIAVDYGIEADERAARRLLDNADRVLDAGGVPDAFDRVAGNLRQQWYDDGFGMTGDRWENEPVLTKLSYLADYAGAYDVSFERYVKAARQALDMTDGQEFTAEHNTAATELFHRSQAKYAHSRAEDLRLAERRQPNHGDAVSPQSAPPGPTDPVSVDRAGPAELKTYDPAEFARGQAPKIKGKDEPVL